MIEELKKHIIDESLIQEAVAKYGGIEFSMTGELVPLEIVETELNDFIKRLKKKMIIYDVSLSGLQLREHEKNRIIDNCLKNGEDDEWKRPGCGRSLGNLGVKCGDMKMPNPYRIEAPEYHLCKKCSSYTSNQNQHVKSEGTKDSLTKA